MIEVPEWLSLGVIVVSLVGGILASLYIKDGQEPEAETAKAEELP